MKKQKIITGIMVTILLVVASFASIHLFDFWPEVSGQPLAIDTYATNESVSALTVSMNAFAMDIYQHMSQGNMENIFFSPYSIFVALAMTYEGARNDTAGEMQSVLNFLQNNETTLCSFGRIYNLLNQDKEYILNTANALWIQENYPFFKGYLEFLENYYMAQATNVSFGKPDEAVRMINEWVEKNTHGKIMDFLQSDNINPLTVMILTNAIYFKGAWETPFDTKKTQDKNFMISPGATITVPMMHSSSEIRCNYIETDTAQILELPYEGDSLSMVILLPKDNDLLNLEQEITLENFSKWKTSFSQREVKITLPKFTLETKYLLKDYLMDMGMTIPFTDAADFSGMTGYHDLFIDKIIHQAYIEVNEEGSEAAAATSVHIALTSIPDYVSFEADHPFIFLIQHQETGTILFMGKVQHPLE